MSILQSPYKCVTEIEMNLIINPVYLELSIYDIGSLAYRLYRTVILPVIFYAY
jgi:hypothetical protein